MKAKRPGRCRGDYCGCCGRECSGNWCQDCRAEHVLPWQPGLALHERTYFAQHAADCPYQVGPLTRRERGPEEKR